MLILKKNILLVCCGFHQIMCGVISSCGLGMSSHVLNKSIPGSKYYQEVDKLILHAVASPRGSAFIGHKSQIVKIQTLKSVHCMFA